MEDLRAPVVERAARELAKRGAEGVAALASLMGKSLSVTTRLNAVWALTRIDGPEARAAVRYALVDHDAGVRQAAVYSAGLHRDAGAEALRIDPPATRREAANALGRIGRVKGVEGALVVQAPPPQPGQPQQPDVAPQPAAIAGPQAAPVTAPAPAPAPEPTPAPAAAPAPAADAKAAPVASTAPATAPTTGPTTAPATAPTAGPATAPGAQPTAVAPAPQQVAAAPPAAPLPPSPAVPALLDALRDGPDRSLEHAVVYALIRIADREGTQKGLQDPDPAARRGARLALDQMGGVEPPALGDTGPGPQGVATQPAAPQPPPQGAGGSLK
jgi:HEAT repeat protein